MRLNVRTDYALRLLTFLAVKSGELATIADVAVRYRISRNHLMKVANELDQAGFIESVRGRSGGLRLAKPPASICLGDVVRHMESDFALVECFHGRSDHCVISPSCKLKRILAEAMSSFLKVLDDYSLQDLTLRNPSLKEIFQSEAV